MRSFWPSKAKYVKDVQNRIRASLRRRESELARRTSLGEMDGGFAKGGNEGRGKSKKKRTRSRTRVCQEDTGRM